MGSKLDPISFRNLEIKNSLKLVIGSSEWRSWTFFEFEPSRGVGGIFAKETEGNVTKRGKGVPIVYDLFDICGG